MIIRCETCEKYKNMSENDKRKNELEHRKHIENKDVARDLKNADKARAEKNSEICVANYDMQKVLTTPRSDIGIMYYLSKFNIWNLTIYEFEEKPQGHCNLWNEVVGNRGSNEIASFVYTFIKEKTKYNVKEFVFYSDNCGGQNRNKNVFSMYFKAANDFNVEITHR